MALLAEEYGGLGKEVGRQFLRTHRAFTATILTPDGAAATAQAPPHDTDACAQDDCHSTQECRCLLTRGMTSSAAGSHRSLMVCGAGSRVICRIRRPLRFINVRCMECFAHGVVVARSSM